MRRCVLPLLLTGYSLLFCDFGFAWQTDAEEERAQSLAEKIFVAGTVCDEDSSKPIPGVKLELSHQPARVYETRAPVVTNEWGEFEITDVPRSWKLKPVLFLIVSAPGGEPYLNKVAMVKLSGDETPEKVEIKLMRGHLLKGRMVNQKTGKGIDSVVSYHSANPVAQQYVEPLDKSVDWQSVSRQGFRMPTFVKSYSMTDAEGNFSISVIEGAGQLQVMCKTIDQYSRLEMAGKEIERRFAVEINPEKAIDDLRIEFVPLSSVAVNVQAENGEPVNDFQVIGDVSLESRLKTFLSSNKHSNTFDIFGFGKERILVVVQPEQQIGIVRLIPADTTKVEPLVLQPCATIKTKLSNLEEGDNAQGITAWIDDIRIMEQRFGRLSDGDVVQLQGLPPHSKYTIELTDGDFRRRRIQIGELLPGQTMDLGEVDMVSPFQVAGTVTQKNGKPVAGADVEIGSPDHVQTTTNKAGQYELSFKLEESRRDLAIDNRVPKVHVRPPEALTHLLPTEMEIPREDPNSLDPIVVNVCLQTASMLNGRVVDSISGKPIMAIVHFVPKDGDLLLSDLTTRANTDEQGQYSLPVMPGKGRLCVRANDPLKYELQPRQRFYNLTSDLEIDEKSLAEDHELELVQLESMSIEVVMEDGEPVKKFEVFGQFRSQPLPIGFPPGSQYRYPGSTTDVSQYRYFSNSVEIFGLDDGHDRLLLAFDEANSRGAARMLRKDSPLENSEALVLRPCATVTGTVSTGQRFRVNALTPLPAGKRYSWVTVEKIRQVNDSFELTHLLPGLSYEIRLTSLGDGSRRNRTSAVLKIESVKPGQRIELGNIELIRAADK